MSISCKLLFLLAPYKVGFIR
uniref:Uncharacterized protein n=1 Tax=Rhizophora mucronata TaxID=61149 RepID=A0A2P2J1Y8_RHIMU